jgi:Flp pilus assembly protein TadG
MMTLFRSFVKDVRGVSALMFGLGLPAVALAVGGGIDLSQAASRRQRIASAVELGCQHAAQEVSFQKRQTNADPNKDYTSTVNQIVNGKVTAISQSGISGIGVTSSIANNVISVTATANSANVFGGILGYDTVSLRVQRNCNVIAVTTGTVLFTESFEVNHNVASNSWTVLNNWNGWTTQSGKGGIEINGIPELAANTIRFGNFFAELDSHCYVQSCQTNSNMWREFALTPGTYELSYWYISRVRNPAYAGKTYCAYNKTGLSVTGDSAAKWSELAGATWEQRTNRIEVFFQEKKSGSYATPAKDQDKATDQVDVCVHTDVWTERKITLNITKSATYRIFFQAAGRQDTYGGLIDYIRFCSTRCP